MNKAVLISVQPKWCELIAVRKKTVEVRKTAPKIKTTFKCYIYQTRGKRAYSLLRKLGFSELPERLEKAFGKVIGEFVCDKIWQLAPACKAPDNVEEMACLTRDEIVRYLNKCSGYGWHISDLVIYDDPKPLSDFSLVCDRVGRKGCKRQVFRNLGDGHTGYKCERMVKRAPQSWCYVEELT